MAKIILSLNGGHGAVTVTGVMEIVLVFWHCEMYIGHLLSLLGGW